MNVGRRRGSLAPSYPVIGGLQGLPDLFPLPVSSNVVRSRPVMSVNELSLSLGPVGFLRHGTRYSTDSTGEQTGEQRS